MNMASNSRDALVWRGAIAVPRAQLLREAAGLAVLLPDGEFVMNLCEQRENFLLLFAAAALGGRTQLMPAARGEAALAELGIQYPEATRVGDEEVQAWRTSLSSPPEIPDLAPPDPERLVMVGFTSGSTGKSQPHPKRWRALAASARLNSAAIRAALGIAPGTVARGLHDARARLRSMLAPEEDFA